MLDSIDGVCKTSGIKIEQVDLKFHDWGGGLKARLKFLDREIEYVAIQRMPSHAVHGSWVDLYKNHLEYDSKTERYSPNPTFAPVDARMLTSVPIPALDAANAYLAKFFGDIPKIAKLIERITVLTDRIHTVSEAHEKLFSEPD